MTVRAVPPKIQTCDLSDADIAALGTAGILDDALLGECVAADLADAGVSVGGRVKLRRVFPDLAPVPVSKDSPTLAADSRRQVQRMILDRLAAGDRSSAIIEEATHRGISGVVMDGGDVLPDESVRYLDHLAGGGSPVTVWRDQPVVKLGDLLRRLRWSPTTGEELQAGVAPGSGVDWGTMAVERAAVVRLAVCAGMLNGFTDGAIHTMFAAVEPDEHVKRALRRFTADEITKAVDALCWSQLQPVRVEPDITRPDIRSPGLSMSASTRLERLLLSLFSADDLRAFVRYLPDGDDMAAGLPGKAVSPAELVHAAVNVLRTHGAVTAGFFDRLVAARPRRRIDIDAVRADLLV